MEIVDANLVLEDGTVFPGRSVGAAGVAAGEACFTTASAGYEQAVTDPSYARQVLTFASPLVGNYGVDERLLESSRVWTEGVVMRRARPAWSAWLAHRRVVALEEVDTRALVRRLRDDGAMRCALGTAAPEELHARALGQPHIDWPRMLAEPELASPPPALEACVAEPYTVGVSVVDELSGLYRVEDCNVRWSAELFPVHPRGQHDDRQLGLATNRGRDVDAVEARQSEVEDDEMRTASSARTPSPTAIASKPASRR